jgi:hypothetical protein
MNTKHILRNVVVLLAALALAFLAGRSSTICSSLTSFTPPTPR